MCGWRDGEHANIFKAASVVSRGTRGSGAEEHARGTAWVLGGKDVVSHLGCKACGAGGTGRAGSGSGVGAGASPGAAGRLWGQAGRSQLHQSQLTTEKQELTCPARWAWQRAHPAGLLYPWLHG